MFGGFEALVACRCRNSDDGRFLPASAHSRIVRHRYVRSTLTDRRAIDRTYLHRRWQCFHEGMPFSATAPHRHESFQRIIDSGKQFDVLAIGDWADALDQFATRN